MKPVFHIDASALTLKELNQVFSTPHTLQLTEEVKDNIKNCRTYLESKLADNKAPFYGINTGFGSLCNVKISDDELSQLQLNLVRSHACGMGDRVPDEISRLILFLKIKNMSLGHSGVRLELVERMVDLYNKGIAPTIYELGSLGASGDLAPLAHLGLTILGEDENNPLDAFGLCEKEGLAILNGTQFSMAYGSLCTMSAMKLYHLANTVASLSLEAFLCDKDPFNALIHQVRPHKGQIECAKEINSLREGSSFSSIEKVSVQDPYSFRCIPQVHGASYQAIQHAREVVETELNSVTDNPLIFPDEDKIMSGGNFHAQPVALVLDYLALALSEIGSISERRIYQMINGDRDLPQFLVTDPGLNSGFMIPQYTAASIASQNKQLTTPASADSIISCKGQEDHVSMAANAATKCLRVVKNVKRILAIEYVVAAQALEYRRPHKTSEVLENLVGKLRKEVPFYKEDRLMHNDLASAEALIGELMEEMNWI